MKRLFTIVLLMTLVIGSAYTQPFSQLNAGFKNLGSSTARFVDYDQDGDLDVFLSGMDYQENVYSLMYVNENGTFSEMDLGWLPFARGDVGFADYDMDNDLDLYMYGATENDSTFFALYENFDGLFMYKSTNILPVKNGKSDWGDYDSDGDLDLVVTGNWQSKIFRNDDGEFFDSGFDFGSLNNSCAAWGDYDNDGDADLLIGGDTGAGPVIKLIRNDQGDFIDSGIELPGLISGEIDFVDFDSDGDLDLSLNGYDEYLVPQFYVMENKGSGIFEEAYLGIAAIAVSAVDWGDFDNDGDMDVATIGAGAGCGLFVGKIYSNEGSYFVGVEDIASMTKGSLHWGDYDNDGDLDLLASGKVNDVSPKSVIYHNDAGSNQFVSNTLPEEPSGLTSELTANGMLLSWNEASDGESPQSSLTYNVRVSTASNSFDVVSPMSDGITGFRRVIEEGNAGNNLAYNIGNLAEGTYYWSVQTIDQCYAGSAFAEEQSFDVLWTALEDNTSKPLSLLYDHSIKTITANGFQNQKPEINVYDLGGRLIKSSNGRPNLPVGDLQGIIIVHLISGKQSTVEKIIIP